MIHEEVPYGRGLVRARRVRVLGAHAAAGPGVGHVRNEPVLRQLLAMAVDVVADGVGLAVLDLPLPHRGGGRGERGVVLSRVGAGGRAVCTPPSWGGRGGGRGGFPSPPE